MKLYSILFLAFLALTTRAVKYNLDPPKVEYAKPWKQGVNVCAYLSRPGQVSHNIYTYCLPWKMDYCGAKTSFKYECCPGFKRTSRFGNKCVERERTYKTIPDLLKIRGHARYAKLLTDSKQGAGQTQLTDNNAMNTYTVFVPYDDNLIDGAEVRMNKFNGMGKNHPILFSVVKGRVYADKLQNGMTLKSEYKDQPLKVTKYSNGIVCIECKQLVEPDHEAKNGVIHYFSGIMTPHTGAGKKRDSIMQLLTNDPRTSAFAKAIPSDLRKLLSDAKSGTWYTVFAPTNDAWRSITSRYPGQAGVIARNHIMKSLFCKAALISNVKNLGPTLSGDSLRSSCDSSGERSIQSQFGPQARVSSADNMAGNGVVHIINNVLVPSRVMSLKDILNSGRLSGSGAHTQWLNNLKECDLRMTSGQKYAVLIPVRRAFNWWQGYKKFEKYYQRFQSDRNFRCRLIRFHIAAMTGGKESNLEKLWLQQEGYRTNNKDKQWEVDYFQRKAWGSRLYFHYSPTAQFKSIPFKGGSIYLIERVNMIPEKRIIDILPTRSDLSTTNQKTRAADMDNRVFKKNEPLNLYLAIRNKGWTSAAKAYVGEGLQKFLLLHWVNNWLWGGDIGYFERSTRHRFMSGAGQELIFDREADGKMYIGYEGLPRKQWAMVVEWNLFAIDGNIWILDKPLICPGKLCAKKKILEEEIWKVLTFACWESLRAGKGAKASDMEPWLDSVEGNQCFTNRETPKKTTETHEE